MVTPRIFLLSPANCGGKRARLLLSPTTKAAMAPRLHSADGVPLAEVFAFVSGLYFRGKITYARCFAAPPETGHPLVGGGIQVITPNAGLRLPEYPLTAAELQRLTGDLIAADNPAYTEPLIRSCRVLAREIGPDCEVILLGSIASPKYVDILLDVFGEQLRFPLAFVGRGDMSRGGLLLRHAAAGEELVYGPVRGALRTGTRPPRLVPLARASRAASVPAATASASPRRDAGDALEGDDE